MGSRRTTRGEAARLPELSRRAVIVGTPVVTLAAAKVLAATMPPAAVLVTSDNGTRQCLRWLAVDAKIAHLQTRWAKLESWLVQEHDWFQLSSVQRQALPGAQELRDIDGCLDVLFEQRDSLLASLPVEGCANLDSIIARLGVVERLIWPDIHPEAHALIAGARLDLIAMSARGGGI